MPRYWKILALIALVLVTGSIGSQVALAKQPDAEAFVVMRPRDAKSQRPQPKTNLLASGGGAIQKSTQVYISFWGPEWQAGFTTGNFSSGQAQDYMLGFFQHVGGSTWIENDNQYCQGVGRGVTACPSTADFITNPNDQFGDAWNDPTPVPARPSQADIAAAAIRARDHFRSLGAVDDSNATFMVFTPTQKSMNGFGTQWCGWHSSTSVPGSRIAYAYIPYMPDAGGSCGMNYVNTTNGTNGTGYFDGFSIVAGHEYEEAKSDPFPNSGWTDSSGAENADKCAWNVMSSNIVLNGKSYAVQPLWSNKTKGCVDPTP